MDKLQIGEQVVFRFIDGYPDRARFLRMEGDRYLLRHQSGDLLVPREDIIDVVRPKPVAYAERPIIPSACPAPRN